MSAQEALAAISRLKSSIGSAESDWKFTVLEAIADWPLANEDVGGETFEYLIGGEAFNWRLLAQRLLGECGSVIPDETLWEWLSDSVLFAGFEEPDFMRAVGVDKFRAHLSYFYGVTVEQSLLVAVEEEVTHQRVGSGRQLSDGSLERAYALLYDPSNTLRRRARAPLGGLQTRSRRSRSPRGLAAPGRALFRFGGLLHLLVVQAAHGKIRPRKDRQRHPQRPCEAGEDATERHPPKDDAPVRRDAE